MLVMTTIFISKMESLPPTSTTKMIDYWLVLCQLVPFAQVVLITAMEYLRKEERTKETLDAITQCDLENMEGSDPEMKEGWNIQERKPKINHVSMLMVIGKFPFFFRILFLKTTFSSEKRVLPSLVLVAFIVYFGIASIFYFN